MRSLSISVAFVLSTVGVSAHALDQSADDSKAITLEASTTAVLVGLVTVGAVIGVYMSQKDVGKGGGGDVNVAERRAQIEAMRRALRQNHAAFVRDVTLGGGPALDAVLVMLGLDAGERRAFAQALIASPEQTVLLESLSQGVEGDRAVAFASAFTRVAATAVGKARLDSLYAAAKPTP